MSNLVAKRKGLEMPSVIAGRFSVGWCAWFLHQCASSVSEFLFKLYFRWFCVNRRQVDVHHRRHAGFAGLISNVVVVMLG